MHLTQNMALAFSIHQGHFSVSRPGRLPTVHWPAGENPILSQPIGDTSLTRIRSGFRYRKVAGDNATEKWHLFG